jgi:hypothetical protein
MSTTFIGLELQTFQLQCPCPTPEAAAIVDALVIFKLHSYAALPAPWIDSSTDISSRRSSSHRVAALKIFF